MTERDIKLLWGRSGNRCALCKAELSQDKKLSSEKFPLGEQAHIVGEKESAARGKSNLSIEERDGYSNRILLCPTHHVEVDRDKQCYSVERLHFVKQQHELWVQESLSERTDSKKQAEELVYSALIDAAVKHCHFSEWNHWVRMSGNSRPRWRESIVLGVHAFQDRVFRATWPGSHPELEKALKTLSNALVAARDTFMKHSEYGRYEESTYDTVPFYKLKWHEDSEVYDSLLAEYTAWEWECFFWLWISTKAANWVCDVVRRDINPLFFAVEGRFVFDGGINESYSRIPEFSAQERKVLPDGMKRLFNKYMSRQKKVGS